MRHLPVLTTAALALSAITVMQPSSAGAGSAAPPYPHSQLLSGIAWDRSTYRNAGKGGDIWSNTTAPGGVVYTAWSDGVIGCPALVSFGVAELVDGPTTDLRTVGCGPRGYGKGKFTSMLSIGSTLYAAVNVQDRLWPKNSVAIWHSVDGGRSWLKPSWTFSGPDLRPNSFVNFGAGYTGARDNYVYLAAINTSDNSEAFYLLRVLQNQLSDKAAYQYFSGTASAPAWSPNRTAATPVFTDGNGIRGATITYDAGLGRYILTIGHGNDAGNLGIFEAAEPWGSWSTVDYEGRWLGINSGEYLGVRPPTGWMSPDGKTV